MKTENTENNFYAFRGQWLDHLVERQDIGHAEFRVAYFIASKINPDDKCMWWSVASIADEMGVSCATVSKAAKSLGRKGLLIVTKRYKGGHNYSMRMPLDPSGELYRNLKNPRKKTGGKKKGVSKNEIGYVSKNENKSNKA